MPAKSQWDFGELFPTEAIHKVQTVSELTAKVRRLLEKEIAQVWVTGEVSNLREMNSGHVYFTLKDSNAQLSCVLFRDEPVQHRDYLEDGQKVILQGDFTVYESRGQYQLVVRGIELRGLGALQAAFEKLKRKLEAEGLFATDRKRPIPRFPTRIGLVTSRTGAAIHDVLHVMTRRYGGLEIVLASCRVQGAGAAQEIACAIDLLNEWGKANRLDVILVTRGGGSFEDLWAFNEEVVARAIARSTLPVVSAIGHEVDFTIADFVADLRAATPSAAAEILTQGFFEARQQVMKLAADVQRCTARNIGQMALAVKRIQERLLRLHPKRILQERWQHLDELDRLLRRCLRQVWQERALAVRNLRERLGRTRPSIVVAQRRNDLKLIKKRLAASSRACMSRYRERIQNLQASLRLLSPENVLARGYSVTSDAASGKILRRASEVAKGQVVLTRLADGSFTSTAQ